MIGPTFAILISLVLLIIALNRGRKPKFGPQDPDVGPDQQTCAANKLSVMTWNLGFAGLGHEADFFADGGKSVRPLSGARIGQAATAIADHLATQNSDVICIQENAGPGFLTRGVDLRGRIDAALTQLQRFHWSDLKTVCAPAVLRVDHGMSLYARHASTGCEILKLPQVETFYFGVLKKFYVGQLCRLPIKGSDQIWSIINLHLSAFDAGGKIRSAQLDALFKVAAAEYAAGHFVVIGGDWNMRLTDTQFAHKTSFDNLAWLMDLPTDVLPTGWQIAIDPLTPTVRTLQTPYVAGQNYTTIVDGFVVSPNVGIDEVLTLDLGFRDSDHQPVTARFTAKAQT